MTTIYDILKELADDRANAVTPLEYIALNCDR